MRLRPALPEINLKHQQHPADEWVNRIIMQYQWFLFDIDDTLYDHRGTEANALIKTFEDFGLEFQEEFRPVYQQINARLFTQMEQGHIDAATVQVQRFKDLFAQLELDFKPISQLSSHYLEQLALCSTILPGALDTVEQLAKNSRVALLTNGFTIAKHKQISISPLKPYIEHLFISEEIGYAKPSWEIFDYSFAKMGRPERSKVLMVGDSLQTDIRGGNRYGIDTCWINRNHLERSSDITPTIEIGDISQLPAALD
ncbi:YjjG family noncanonical pyrimidine nucleotidase [Gynuella sunshinyii]|uniref:Putative hydrolase (HAD superfamily) n=1 Tax=Gynuella sunshinyii YC6258 TaxID=1445510 RepID=A0A0C5VD09_9GAMM|nr:YjjG family noncanonical pyrimidine nucleotidase [Gynuella sunshinyii]AJQ92402.1 putative hydrolase (HAD superfamily) [Gynuella sunshinyii YC6258]